MINLFNILKLAPVFLLVLACQYGQGGQGGIETRSSNLNSGTELNHARNLISGPEAERIEYMIREMTIEEKVGQMTQLTLDVLGEGDDVHTSFEPFRLDPDMMSKAFVDYHVGSILNTSNNRARTPEVWNNIIKEIQDYAMEHSRFDIPVIYGLDLIHGASYVDGATLFPQQVGMAATWNPELVKRAGEITAYESRAIGIAWTFSPVLDLGVDPRWPRHWETFGEDPYLSSVLGYALVTGYEGPGISSPYHIASCLKHYLGYSHTLSGRDRTPAWIPESQLREYHVPPFQAGLDAGSMTVMLNSGEINGIPVNANKELITGLLKNEQGLQGFVLTDWWDVLYLHTRHRVASSYKDAVRIAINAGVDMAMVPYDFDFSRYLVELVNEGEVSMERIDDAVRRILSVKMAMGLFETPYTLREDYPEFASREFADAAYKTAVESVTLLKNEGQLLPLSRETRILVAGPAANTMRPLNGGWSYSWQGNLVDEFATDYNTIYEALTAKAGPGRISMYEAVRYNHDGAYSDEFVDDFDVFRDHAAQADVILLAIGENSYTEGEGDLDDLYLSDNQQRLVLEAASTGKPVILAMAQGRPRIISKIEPAADAILNLYLPGNYGGDALASIIYGDANPSGKLPYTYPRYPNQLIPYYHKHTERVEKSGTPTGTAFYPQYEFGFGLSYSEFEYMSMSAANNRYALRDTVFVSVELRNTSERAGEEVVQLYSSQQYASITPPVKRLRAFEKTMVPAGESITVTFAMPVTDLAFVNADNRKVVESGPYILRIADLETEITVTETGFLN